MTSAYFELVRSSSSSMGGLVMPSGTATVPANWLLLPGPGDRVRYQGYQLLGRTLGRVVDDGHVELRLGRQLDAGLVEPSPPNLLRLGAPADQPPPPPPAPPRRTPPPPPAESFAPSPALPQRRGARPILPHDRPEVQQPA